MTFLFLLLINIQTPLTNCNIDPYISELPDMVTEGQVFKIIVSGIPARKNIDVSLLTCEEPCLIYFDEMKVISYNIKESWVGERIIIAKTRNVDVDTLGRGYLAVNDVECNQIYFIMFEIPILNVNEEYYERN